MNIQTEYNEQHQALITVELDHAQIEGKKQQAARRLARNTRIPGFRPGKAPYPIILRHLGEGQILETAVESLIDEIYPKILDESGVKPYGPGQLEHLKLEDNPPTVQFSVPLAPEVKLGEYQQVRLPYEKPEITEEAVSKAIQGMQEMYAEVTKVDRPAEETDLVNIILTGNIKDSEDETPYIDHESYPVIIEAETADSIHEWPFPGFSRSLIGCSAEESKNVSYTFPEDYEEEDSENNLSLKGKTVDYEIQVTKVSSRTVPEVNETFIKRMGPYETVEEFEKDTRQQLNQRNSSSYDEEYVQNLLDEIIKEAEFKYPQQAVEDEVDLVLNRLKNRLENQGIGFDLYLKTRGITEEQVREEIRPGAEQRLKESLLLMEIAAKENIQIKPEEIQDEVQHALGHLLSGMTEREAQQTFNEAALRGLTANIYNNTLLTKTVQHLRDMASGKLEEMAENSAESSTEEGETAVPESEDVEAENAETPIPVDEIPEAEAAEISDPPKVEQPEPESTE